VKSDPQTEVVRRLRCAAGHLNAVIEMAEEGQPCEKVLHQLNAVESALHAAEIRMVTLRVDACEATLRADISAAQRSAELIRLLDLYAIMMRKTNQTTR
jgi:hypothetical protein NreA